MKLSYIFVLILVLQPGLYAQNAKSSQAKIDALYQEALTLSQQGNSLKSSQRLREILKLDSTSFKAWFALADLSHEAGKPDEEQFNLRKGLTLAGDAYPVGFKFLAEILYRKGDYNEAVKQMEHYAVLKPALNPSEKLLLESCRFSVGAINNPVSFEPINPGDSINTPADEYWPSLNAEANELVFTRLERTDRNGKIIQIPQEDFYLSKLDSIGWRKAKPLGEPINTAENEGAQTLSADGKLLLFTGCGRPDGVGGCDLYLAVNRNGKWTTPMNLGEPVNSGAWESQPSLSADGNTLYFVSNRRGGKGNMDIWKAEKTAVSAEGIPLFGNVMNVSEINTAGNDQSPCIHADGKTLYFASDSRPGLGGTDLYLSRIENDKWTQPVNLGFPINTNGNEEGLITEISGERAWFTSNRNPDNGRDIYYFTLPKSVRPEPVSFLKGIILDALTAKKISASITLVNLETKMEVRTISSSENEGDFLVCLPSGINYGLNITRKGYLFVSENVSLLNGYTSKIPKNVTIRLHPIVAGAFTTLKNIFFETNSWQLKEESVTQLNQMAEFMKLNPDVVMEVVGHTDRVGTEAYNLDLSQKRAGTVVEELKKRGVEPYRIKGRGVGFAFPVGDNGNEEGRSANRRTEFLVKELKR